MHKDIFLMLTVNWINNNFALYTIHSSSIQTFPDTYVKKYCYDTFEDDVCLFHCGHFK